MKTSLLISIVFTMFLLLIASCKKDDNTLPQEPAYRLISEAFFSGSDPIDQTDYTFSENRLSYLEHQDGNHLYMFDYAYADALVTATSSYLDDTVLHTAGRTDYIFENDLLKEINTWAKVGDNWHQAFSIELTYTGNHLAEYIEYKLANPYARGVYTYENEHLVRFEAYHYTNAWVKWINDEFQYSGDTLKVYYSTIATTGILKVKMDYCYQDGLLIRINNFVDRDGDWELIYLTDYQYDNNDNAILEEVRFASDSSLYYHTEFQYEKGVDNLESFIYTGVPDDPDMIYPTPTNHFTNPRLLRMLMDEK